MPLACRRRRCPARRNSQDFRLRTRRALRFRLGLLERGALTLGEDEAFPRQLRFEDLQTVFRSGEVEPAPDGADAVLWQAQEARQSCLVSRAHWRHQPGLRRAVRSRRVRRPGADLGEPRGIRDQAREPHPARRFSPGAGRPWSPAAPGSFPTAPHAPINDGSISSVTMVNITSNKINVIIEIIYNYDNS